MHMQDQVSKLNLPQAFLEYRVRLYSKTKDNTKEELDHLFDRVKKYFEKPYFVKIVME